MLRSLDSLLGFAIMATDGEIGKAYNVLFDDRTWAVRYLVVETGTWLTRRKVLLSPAVLHGVDSDGKTIGVMLTREQVRTSPDVDADLPVSRQQELDMMRHYHWPDYLSPQPALPTPGWIDTAVPIEAVPVEDTGDPHLRSAKEVSHYHVDASDGPLGSIVDLIVDDETWTITELVVDLDEPSGHKVLAPAGWVSEISLESRTLELSHVREHCVSADLLHKT